MKSKRVRVIVAVGVLLAVAVGVLLTSTSTTKAIDRLGAPDPSCNAGRPIQLTNLSPTVEFPLDIQLGDLDVFGSWSTKGTRLRVVLDAINENCDLAAGFGNHGTATVSYDYAGRSVFVHSIVELSSDRLLIVGGVGSDWLLGEVDARGTLVSAFGKGGWDLLSVPVPVEAGQPASPSATDAAISPSGTIFIAGTDGRAHCCVQDYVAAISAEGELDHSFAHEGWITGLFGGSWLTEVFATDHGGVLAMGVVDFMQCGGSQFLDFTSNGDVDRDFDRKLKASFRRIAPPPRFLDATVLPEPDGGFDLMGDVFPGCVAPEFPSRQTAGVLEEILPNGSIDHSSKSSGTTRFGFDDSQQVWGVPLSSGGLALVTEPEPISYRSPMPTILRVREFTADGILSRDIGEGGVASYNFGPLVGKFQDPTVSVIPGPKDTMFVVGIGDHGTEITRLLGS